MEFTCDCCHYKTAVKSNYAKHLATNKHIIQKYKQTTAYKVDVLNTPQVLAEDNQNVKDTFLCKQSMCHMNSCPKSSENDPLIEIKELKSENKALRKQLDQQQNLFEKQFEIQSKQIVYLICLLEQTVLAV